mmetsp:Transcript_43067/g.119095  ORF Transcript_43067/g.119095 Transcript_43067/m.119095 type:complete len:533 (+) Transcript_43067:1495-3093(+)
MHGVAAQERVQTVALQGFHENDRGAATHLRILRRLVERGINLLVVVAARNLESFKEFAVAEVRDAVEKAMLLKDVLANQSTVRFCMEPLAVAIGCGFQRLDETAVTVGLDELVELRAPNELYHVEPGSAEHTFELLDDLRITAYGAIEPLVVAIHDENHVVEPLAPCHRNRVDRFGLVHLAIPDEGPDAAVGCVSMATKVQVAEEARLVYSSQRAEPHGHRRVLPKVRHQPWVWVARHAVPVSLLAEVHDVLQGEAALEERAGINARSRVPLDVQAVALAPAELLAAEEMVLAALVDHVRGPDLHVQVARILWFGGCRDGVNHRCDYGWLHVDAEALCFLHDVMHEEPRPRCAVVLHNSLQRFKPLLCLGFVEVRARVPKQREAARIVACVLMHERQGRRERRHAPSETRRELSIANEARLVGVERREKCCGLSAPELEPRAFQNSGELLLVEAFGSVHVRPHEPFLRQCRQAADAFAFEYAFQLLHQLLGSSVHRGAESRPNQGDRGGIIRRAPRPSELLMVSLRAPNVAS